LRTERWEAALANRIRLPPTLSRPATLAILRRWLALAIALARLLAARLSPPTRERLRRRWPGQTGRLTAPAFPRPRGPTSRRLPQAVEVRVEVGEVPVRQGVEQPGRHQRG